MIFFLSLNQDGKTREVTSSELIFGGFYQFENHSAARASISPSQWPSTQSETNVVMAPIYSDPYAQTTHTVLHWAGLPTLHKLASKHTVSILTFTFHKKIRLCVVDFVGPFSNQATGKI